ncbi:MAG: hypothetical protein WCD72_04340 [Dehalococcoidia bacterium]
MNILVTGAAGYIGGIVAQELIKEANSELAKAERGWKSEYGEFETVEKD